jgi:hypothetical protein
MLRTKTNRRFKRTGVKNQSRGGAAESTLVVQPVPVGQSILRFNGTYMPPKFLNYMHYAEVWACTTAGGLQGYVYKMNSVYDPFSGAGGNACHGIDVLQSIYDRYRVLDATMTITATIQAVESTMLYAYPTADSTTPTQTIAESSPEVKSLMLAQYWPQVLTIHAKTSKWLMNARDYDASAASNADPAKLAYFGILVRNTSAAALNVVMRVSIVYHTEWSVRKVNDDTDA